MTVQFVCQRGVGGLFVFPFLICVGTPMIREGGPIVHEPLYVVCVFFVDTRCGYAFLECSKHITLFIVGLYGNYFFTLVRQVIRSS